jgi:hypothetical protein
MGGLSGAVRRDVTGVVGPTRAFGVREPPFYEVPTRASTPRRDSAREAVEAVAASG